LYGKTKPTPNTAMGAGADGKEIKGIACIKKPAE